MLPTDHYEPKSEVNFTNPSTISKVLTFAYVWNAALTPRDNPT